MADNIIDHFVWKFTFFPCKYTCDLSINKMSPMVIPQNDFSELNGLLLPLNDLTFDFPSKWQLWLFQESDFIVVFIYQLSWLSSIITTFSWHGKLFNLLTRKMKDSQLVALSSSLYHCLIWIWPCCYLSVSLQQYIHEDLDCVNEAAAILLFFNIIQIH